MGLDEKSAKSLIEAQGQEYVVANGKIHVRLTSRQAGDSKEMILQRSVDILKRTQALGKHYDAQIKLIKEAGKKD